MTSFIELPQLAFDGRETLPIYVNTADVITVAADYDGQTVLNVRDLGSECMTAKFKTYIPLHSILDVLGELAKWPGVRSWTDETKAACRGPIAERLKAARDAERAAR